MNATTLEKLRTMKLLGMHRAFKTDIELYISVKVSQCFAQSEPVKKERERRE